MQDSTTSATNGLTKNGVKLVVGKTYHFSVFDYYTTFKFRDTVVMLEYDKPIDDDATLDSSGIIEMVEVITSSFAFRTNLKCIEAELI